MKIKTLNQNFSVCKLQDTSCINFNSEYLFLSKTDEEISLVCLTEEKPKNFTVADEGWSGFKIDEVLEFSLIGVIAKISKALSENNISVFVVSTFNTDYVFIKKENYDKALKILKMNNYDVF